MADSARVAIIAEQPKFVCRAGLKLEAALDAWAIDVAGLRCLDAGLSTGGFTDCLLQRGAAGVVGVDVGYGQVGGLGCCWCDGLCEWGLGWRLGLGGAGLGWLAAWAAGLA